VSVRCGEHIKCMCVYVWSGECWECGGWGKTADVSFAGNCWNALWQKQKKKKKTTKKNKAKELEKYFKKIYIAKSTSKYSNSGATENEIIRKFPKTYKVYKRVGIC